MNFNDGWDFKAALVLKVDECSLMFSFATSLRDMLMPHNGKCGRQSHGINEIHDKWNHGIKLKRKHQVIFYGKVI
jgi:hypothetical protein